MLKHFRERRLARKHDQALAEMKASAASLAASVIGLFPYGHHITAERLDKAANDLGDDFLVAAKTAWRDAGISDEAIEAIGPLVRQIFVDEFKARLRAELPLRKLSIEGQA